MDAIINRLRIEDRIAFFQRNKFKFGGFIAGALGTFVFAMLMGVIYTGEPIDASPTPPEPVYQIL